MSIKTTGFKMLNDQNIHAAIKWMFEEGTCCLAYGEWTIAGYDILLTEEQKAFHKSNDITDLEKEEWGYLDAEICEAMIMLPVIRNIVSDALYWDGRGNVSTVPFDGAEFSVTCI